MLKRGYEGHACAIARALEVVGDRRTLLVIRDFVLGRHFSDGPPLIARRCSDRSAVSCASSPRTVRSSRPDELEFVPGAGTQTRTKRQGLFPLDLVAFGARSLNG
jgi:hypothetical protein